MDIAARHDDPVLEEVARAIFAMFPRCMRCGVEIPRYAEEDQLGNGLSTGTPGDG